MKKVLLLVLGATLIMSSSLAYGQGGILMCYTDATYTSCNAATLGAGFVYVHIVHEFASMKASRFALQNNNVVGLTWILDQFPAGTSNSAPGGGSTQVGWAVGYGGCQPAPHPVSISWYQDLSGQPGIVGPCGSIEIVADPNDVTGQVTGSDCNDQLQYPGRSKLTVNGDETCPCGEIVPVEETSWGQIKALYE